MTIALLLPAAGASTRMDGADKLLQDVDGQPCLRVLACRGIAAGMRVLVTLAPHHAERRDALSGLDLTVVTVPDADRGMSQSLAMGIAAMPDHTRAAMILPSDMPDITSDDMMTMLAAWGDALPGTILRATTADGVPGHPIIFPRESFAAFAHLKGDRGARDVISARADRLQFLALPGQRALCDLDTPKAWQAWRDSKQKLR